MPHRHRASDLAGVTAAALALQPFVDFLSAWPFSRAISRAIVPSYAAMDFESISGRSEPRAEPGTGRNISSLFS